MRNDYYCFIQLGVSFENRSELYDFIQEFRNFLDSSVPVDNFNFQDIKLSFSESDTNICGDRK